MQRFVRGIVYSCLVLMVCSVIWSCQGPAGPAGADGRNGVDGNANVTSTTFTFVPSDLVRTFSDDRVYGLTRSISSITSDVVNRGVIIVYLRSTDITWQALPVTEPGFGLSSSFDFFTGNIRLSFRVTTGNARTTLTTWMPGASYSVRVITIPATTVAVALKGVDVNNYDAVMTALDMKGAE